MRGWGGGSGVVGIEGATWREKKPRVLGLFWIY